MESHLVSESNSSDSSSDLAGFSDSAIAMPPITSFPPPVPTPISILHQLVQETQKQEQFGAESPADVIMSPADLDPKPVMSPVQALPPQSPSLSSSTPTAPIGDLSPQGQLLAQTGSQAVSPPGPANGYATLPGSGGLRAPPEGMEDAPLAADVPLV